MSYIREFISLAHELSTDMEHNSADLERATTIDIMDRVLNYFLILVYGHN